MSAGVSVGGGILPCPYPITGTVDVAFPESMAVSGTVGISGSVAVTGPLTDTQLRNSAIGVTLTNASVPVTGPLTDAQLRAATVPVSGIITANAGSGTFAISAASLPLPSGASTETTLSGINAKTPSLGQAAMAASSPVVIASNQSAVPISGTVTANAGTGTLAVSGPLTNAELRASPVPISGSLSVGSAESTATGRSRVNSLRTPGRAGTAGQKIFALHNATGSTKVVHINQLIVDLYQTVIKAVTVAPPTIRVHRFTAVPTNGTSLTKTAKDTTLQSNASVTAWGDASADGTLSASALTVTIPAGSMLTQEFAPRLITAAGYEMFDRTELLEGKDVVLRALEGIVVFLDYTLATQNPATDIWIVGCDWYEI